MTEESKLSNKTILIATAIVIVLIIAAISVSLSGILSTDANEQPTAVFSCPQCGSVDENLIFNASLSSDSDGDIISYLWNFGDGANDTGVVVTHAYDAPGSYNISLIVIDDDGEESAPAFSELNINSPPIAIITLPIETEYDSQVVHFNGANSYDTDGEVVAWEWNFGDGSNSSSVAGDHEYSANGIYDITLIVTDNEGASSIPAVVTINVNASVTYLEGWTSPSSVSVACGYEKRIYIYASLKSTWDAGTNVSTSISLTTLVRWQPTTDALGTISRGYAPDGTTYFTITTDTPGTSKLNFSLRFDDIATSTVYLAWVIVNVTVDTPVIDFIEISPAEAVLLKQQSQIFIGTAYLSNGSVASGATYSWSLSSLSLGTLSTSVGNTTNFTAGDVEISGNITCTAMLDGNIVNSSAEITVLLEFPDPCTTIRVYDMFNVPFRSFWDDRNDSELMTASFPYLQKHMGTPLGNYWLYSNYRMNVTARNVSTVSTLDNPWYMPVFSDSVKGGTIQIDWYGDYLDLPQTEAYRSPLTGEGYPQNVIDWYDSWFWQMNGTVTMDRTAAKMVLDMTDADLDDFDTWKMNRFDAFVAKFSQWLADEAEKYGLFYCYEYPYNSLSEEYDIYMVDDKVVFEIVDHLSWGVESILGRWWSYTFLEFEYWPEAVHFTAEIGPIVSDFNLQCDQQYTMPAITSTRDGRTSYVFECVHGDCIPGANAYYSSQINPYLGTEGYWNFLVGNYKYGQLSEYDYTPWAWNLSENDQLIIEWPDSSNILGYNHVGTNDYSSTVIGNVTPRWIEPVPGEAPDVMDIDFDNRTITISGPFDAYSWSQNSLAARELHENWSRTGLLPHGCPWIEFVINSDANQAPIACIIAPESASTNATVEFNGTASWDVDGAIVQYEWVFTEWVGTPSNVLAIWNSSASTVVHTWTNDRNVTVNLTVTDDDGLTDTYSIVIRVAHNARPVAILTADNIGYTGIPMTFDGSSSYDPDGSIANYTWDFGDGTIGYGAIIDHTYSEYSMFDVTLTVTDDFPGTPSNSSDSKSIAIVLPEGKPIAKIVIQHIARVGTSVDISGAMSFSPSNTSLTAYEWDFGDLNTSTGVDVTHTWTITGSYTVTLIVRDSFGNESYPVTAEIWIVPAIASALSVSLSKHSLLPSETTTLTIKAVDGAGNVVTTFNGDVDVTCNDTTGVTGLGTVTLASGVGSTTMSFANSGSYNITVTESGLSISGNDLATVSTRTIEFRVYDIFEYPLFDWWDQRYYCYLADEPLRYTTPVVEIYRTSSDLKSGQLMTNYRLNVSARNINEISITNPTFVPRMNPAGGTGGNATYQLDWQYLSYDHLIALRDEGKLFNAHVNVWDGWEYLMLGNLTMDREAAAHLIGLPDDSTDPATWWLTNEIAVWDGWEMVWWENESGSTSWGRVDIRASDDYYSLASGWFNSEFSLQELPDGNVSLTYWRVGYGEDILVMRQLYWGGDSFGDLYPNGTPMGILPFECWLEDFHLNMSISGATTDLWLDCAVTYGWRAWKSDTAPENTTAWRWEIIRSDYLPSAATTLESELDLWADRNLQYVCWDPGSNKFGELVDFDYVPAIWDMSVGETLIIEAPRVMGCGFRPMGFVGDESDMGPTLGGYYDNLRFLEKFGEASVHAIGVNPGDAVYDAATGDLKIVGPFYPVVDYIPAHPWLHYEPAPRIELWI